MTPQEITRAIRLGRRLTLRLSQVQTRAFVDAPTAEELALEGRWSDELELILLLLYLLAQGFPISTVPTTSRTAVRRWIADRYTDPLQDYTDQLERSLRVGLRSAATIGGQAALDLLGLQGQFYLTADDVLAQIDRRVLDAITLGGKQSLLDTTVDDITDVLWAQIDAGSTGYAAAIAETASVRSPVRSSLIAISEGTRGVAIGVLATYARNGIERVRFRPREDACEMCSPYRGKVYTIAASRGIIPLHTRCRCIWEPVTDGWTPPRVPWTGGNV